MPDPIRETTARYRLLESGERIQPGDEHLNDDAETWSPVQPMFCIPYRPAVLMPVRRRVREAGDGQ